MPQTTPFHARLEPLNRTKIWKDWSGYLVAPRYQYSETAEYYAIRNAAAILDTSPLFKYRIHGAGADRLIQFAMARDIRKCKVGSAQYTCWCDEAGFVVQDGVVMHVAKDDYWMTSAEPSLRYFRKLAEEQGFQNVTIEDLSRSYGILALQGPHALSVLGQLTADATALRYFKVAKSTIAGKPVTISRTGFTGDLGYEIWVQSENAIAIWDALFEAGANYNLTPLGTTALKMARVEAGLLLMDVDFHSSRFAWVDAQRETPSELGWDWMFRNLKEDDRGFRGQAAITDQLKNKSQRWSTVGLEVDWHDYERIYQQAGIMPPKEGIYCESTMSIYRRGTKQWDYAGYATSFLFSSLLRKPIAIAKLPPDLTNPGTEVELEIAVIRRPENVLARVVPMPFFDPPRKKARHETAASGKGNTT